MSHCTVERELQEQGDRGLLGMGSEEGGVGRRSLKENTYLQHCFRRSSVCRRLGSSSSPQIFSKTVTYPQWVGFQGETLLRCVRPRWMGRERWDLNPMSLQDAVGVPTLCVTKQQVFTGHFLYKTILEASPWIPWDLCQPVAKQPRPGSPRSRWKAPRCCSPGSKQLLTLRREVVSEPGTCSYSEESWHSGCLHKPRRCWKGRLLENPWRILQPPGCSWELNKLNSPRHSRNSSELLRCPWLKTRSLP